MNINEWKQVKEMSYAEYTKYLQDKYDALGCVRKSYYHITGEDNHLTKTSGTSYGKIGLQYHHIREDIVASLSDKNIAANSPIEYQSPENMCYADLLEHLYLHILIAESQKEDEETGKYVGDGGVNWIVLALNSIYSDPTNSWYSRKIENPEEKGLTYNYNNIITDNKDVYLALVNRYCTSAFIRMKQDLTPAELASSLCHTCKNDNHVQVIYDDIMEAAKDTFLFDWNVQAFADLETYLKSNKTALVKICTGGGKTTTGLEYLRVHNCKALVLGSGDTIGESWKDKDNVTYMNYQSFMNCYEKECQKYSIIICDEAHHIQAEEWGKGIRWALANTNIKVIGLTATPNAQQIAGTDEEFQGRICYGLDLADGIKEGNIYPFGYVQSIYKMESVKDEFVPKYGNTGKLLWDKLNIVASQNPAEKILRDNMLPGVRKIIVFVQKCSDKDDVMNILKKYNPLFASENYMRFISSKDSKYATESKKWFDETNDHDVCIVSRDMTNEGWHPAGVNTLIMFRSTKSNRLFLQQLGRIVVTQEGHDNPNGIVFDFTNNAQNLIYKNKSVVEYVKVEEETEEDENKNKSASVDETERIVEVLKDSPVIYKDYTEDCVNVLNALNISNNKNAAINTIYSAFMAELKEIGMPDELFDFNLWKEAKTELGDNLLNITRRTGHGCSSHGSSSNGQKQKSEVLQRGQVKASDAERVVIAFRLLLKRAFDYNVIDFEDNAKLGLIVNDEESFKTISDDIGFKSVESIKNIIRSLKQLAYVTATKITK